MFPQCASNLSCKHINLTKKRDLLTLYSCLNHGTSETKMSKHPHMLMHLVALLLTVLFTMLPSIALTFCPLWYLLFTILLKVVRNLENTFKSRRFKFIGIDWSTPGFIPRDEFCQYFWMLSIDFDFFPFLVVHKYLVLRD